MFCTPLSQAPDTATSGCKIHFCDQDVGELVSLYKPGSLALSLGTVLAVDGTGNMLISAIKEPILLGGTENVQLHVGT